MKMCNNCGTNNPDTSDFCWHCGSRLPAALAEKICPSCKNTMPDDMIFCDKCGTRWVPPVIEKQVNTIAPQSPGKTKKKYKGLRIFAGIIILFYVIYAIVMLNQ